MAKATKKTLTRRIRKLETKAEGDKLAMTMMNELQRDFADIEKYIGQAKKLWAGAHQKSGKAYSVDYLRKMRDAATMMANSASAFKGLGALLSHGKIAGRQVDSEMKDLLRGTGLKM